MSAEERERERGEEEEEEEERQKGSEGRSRLTFSRVQSMLNIEKP